MVQVLGARNGYVDHLIVPRAGVRGLLPPGTGALLAVGRLASRRLRSTTPPVSAIPSRTSGRARRRRGLQLDQCQQGHAFRGEFDQGAGPAWLAAHALVG